MKEDVSAAMCCKAFTFDASNKPLTPVLYNGQHYFVAVEICKILGLGQVSRAVSSLDNDEKLPLQIVRSGQRRSVNCVSESGLYALIFKSRKPVAKAFRKWITSEVLPALRQEGYYETNRTKPETLPERRACRINRLTPDRIIDLLSDVCLIEDKSLRERIANKLKGGFEYGTDRKRK